MAVDGGSVAITASIGMGDQTSSPTVVRFLRGSGGTARPAIPTDTGLLAQGSDDPGAAQRLARQIGLSKRQMIEPAETLVLPVSLSLPSLLDVKLSCQPDGGGRINGRDTLVFACQASQKVHIDNFVGSLQVAGVEEIDVQSGVRLASALSGRLSGEKLLDKNRWQFDHYRLSYRLATDLE